MRTYEEIGKRWQKGNMDRIYINIDGSVEVDEIPVKNFFNRYEWNNLKVYYDNVNKELIINGGSSEAKEAVKIVVEKMLNE